METSVSCYITLRNLLQTRWIGLCSVDAPTQRMRAGHTALHKSVKTRPSLVLSNRIPDADPKRADAWVLNSLEFAVLRNTSFAALIGAVMYFSINSTHTTWRAEVRQ